MSDDYLWDRTGEPDAELAHLEKALGTLRWSSGHRRARVRTARMWWAAAVAAAIVAMIGTAVAVHERRSAHSLTSWQLSFSGEKPRALHAGEWIETNPAAHGSLESEFVGRVDIEPNSRLRLIAAAGHEQQLALHHGTIHALIWAPPAQFVVDTPAAKAVDLGCEYSLHVDKTGVGLLTVEMGWVAFEWHGKESFIPAGGVCRTRPGHGPDTPYFLNASPAFQSALADFDLNGTAPALQQTLAAARAQDALSLWHLLQHASPGERGEVFDRLATLVQLPPQVTREAAVHGDRAALDATWNALNLGDLTWWREWKRQW